MKFRAVILPLRGAAALTVGLGVAVASLTGCTATVQGGSPTSTAAKTPDGPSTYKTIDELQKALDAKGIACKLTYPGLKDDTNNKEVSICTIDNEQAYLTVWADPQQVTLFLGSTEGQTGTVAVGANWTIAVQSNATAQKLATAIGGTAPAGNAPSVSSTTTSTKR